MTTPQPQTRPNSERELVFCYQCEDEWYRDEHGIVCPSCQSDFVEIVENQDSDPRFDGASPVLGTHLLQSLFQTLSARTPPPTDGAAPQHDDHEHPHTPPPGVRIAQPRTATVVHIEGPGYHYHSESTETASPRGDMYVDLFSTMFRNIMGDGVMPQRAGVAQRQEQTTGAEQTTGVGQAPEGGSGTPPGPQRTERTQGPRMMPYAAAFIPTARLNPRDANSAQAGPDPHVIDLPTFLSTVFHPHAGNGPRIVGGDPLSGLLNLFPPPGQGGDYVYSQADLDRVISQLMEQHQGNAPPPAPKEVIESLPRIKVTEQMVIDGTDCAVCKDELNIEEMVCKLPCKHIYHFECVSKWLEEHDTCPICRHPVTPENKQREQRETQAQEQRRQAQSNPLFSWAFGGRNAQSAGAQQPAEQNTTQSPGSGGQQNQPQDRQQSNSRSSGGGFAGLFRRRGSN